MSLPALNWRFVGTQAFASATVAAVLDALYTLGTAVTYADGTVRTPGSGSAGTYTRYQNAGTTEAVYVTPATSTALVAKFIFAGAAVVGTPTMASPDTATNNTLMLSVNKNSGAFNAWNAALPFTSGQFFGYWNLWPTSAGTGLVYLYESQETAYIVVATGGGANTYHGCVGAFIDPQSVAAADAESDGRLYGVMTTGTNAACITTLLSTVPTQLNSPVTWGYAGTAARHHTGVFNPGASTIRGAARLSSLAQTGTTTLLTELSGRFLQYYGMPMGTAGVAAPNDQALGGLRNVAWCSNRQLGQRLVDTGVTVGYVIAATSSATNESFLLAY